MSLAPPPPPDMTIALLPWGDLIEDFLDSIGVSLPQFCEEMTGGWLFGYVEALRTAGIRTVIVCVTARVQEPTRLTHRPTGAPLWLLQAPSSYRRLRRRGLAAPTGTPAAGGPLRAGMRFYVKAALRDVAPYLSTPLVPLARLLRQEGCRAILCQEYEYPRFDACVVLGRLLGLPVFATFQGGTWQASRCERFVRPLTMRAARGFIIAPKVEAARVRYRYKVPSGKIAQVFNPLDLRQWKPVDRQAARRACGFPEDVRLAVWHGRVDLHRKGLDVLLEAWKQVHARSAGGAQLLLVGTGPDAAALRERVESMRLEGTHWVNRYVLDRTELRRYLSAGDVYVLPSRHEGFAVAPLEAMACGLPLVASDVLGIADLLGHEGEHGGLIVPQEAPEELANALFSMLDDSVLSRRLGERARARVAARFSPKAVGAELSAFFRSELSDAPPGTAYVSPK